jgi:O-antigen/teichoic acid export membrane protein
MTTEVIMKFALFVLALILALPVALIVAIALGPVVLGVLCAVGFGLAVFALGSLILGIGTGIERVGSRLAGHH